APFPIFEVRERRAVFVPQVYYRGVESPRRINFFFFFALIVRRVRLDCSPCSLRSILKTHSRREVGACQAANLSGQFGRLRDQLVALFVNVLLGRRVLGEQFLRRFRSDRRVPELFNWRSADYQRPSAS